MKSLNRASLACLTALFLIPLLANAEPDAFVDAALYFVLTQDTVFLPTSTTDTNLQRATIGLAIDYTKQTTDIMLAVDALFRYDTASLQLISLTKTARWNGALHYNLDSASTGTVAIHLDSGNINLDTLRIESAQWVFAELVFKLKARDTNIEGSSQSLDFARADSNWVTNNHGNNLYATSSHCTDGSITLSDYQATFSADTRYLTDAWFAKEFVAVMAQTNARTSAFKHRTVIDRTKYTVDSVRFKDTWSGAYPSWSGDTLEVFAYGNVAEKASSDTLYRIWFHSDCDAAVQDTMPIMIIPSKSWWSPYPGELILPLNESYVDGQVAFPDSAAVEAYINGGPSVVWKGVDTSITFRLKVKQTVDAAFRNGQGFSFAFTWAHENNQIDAANQGSLKLSSVSAVSPAYTWYISVDGGLDTAAVYHSAGNDTVPATSTLTDRLDVVFDWVDTLYDSVVWSNQRVAPRFVPLFGTNSKYTRIPVLKCPSLYLEDAASYRYGWFSDSIQVKMAQFATSTQSSGSYCVDQIVKARSNFDLATCSLTVESPDSSTIVSWKSVRAGLSVSRVNSRKIDVRGTFSTAIAASESYTNIITLTLRANSCPGGSKNVGVAFIDESAYASSNEGYVAIPSYGSATVSCSFECPSPENPYDSLAKLDLPNQFVLYQNYPNPFNPVTTISLSLPKASDWMITIFNVTGQVVKEYGGNSGPGIVEVNWDASQYASGIYFYRAEASEFKETRKMLLLK